VPRITGVESLEAEFSGVASVPTATVVAVEDIFPYSAPAQAISVELVQKRNPTGTTWDHIFSVMDEALPETYQRHELMKVLSYNIKKCFGFVAKKQQEAWAQKTLRALNTFINFEQCLKETDPAPIGKQIGHYNINMAMLAVSDSSDEESKDGNKDKKKQGGGKPKK
jgi:hypothetical protein